MERILNYTLLENGVTPGEPILAGVQGEHRATALVISLDSDFSEVISKAQENSNAFCRIDAVTAAGEFIEGEERPIDQISNPFYLTAPMTASGLDTVVLVRIILKGDTAETVIYKAQIKLYYEPSVMSLVVTPKEKNQVDIFEQKAEEICSLIEEKAEWAYNLISAKADVVTNKANASAEHLKKATLAAEEAEFATTASKEHRNTAERAAENCEENREKISAMVNAASNFANNAAYLNEATKSNAEKAQKCLEETEEHLQHITDLAAQTNLNVNLAQTAATNAAAAEQGAKTAQDMAQSFIEEVKDLGEEIENSVDKTLASFSNALKGKKEGRIVSISDISPIKHPIKITLSGQELSNANVNVCGKNMFNSNLFITTPNGKATGWRSENGYYIGRASMLRQFYNPSGTTYECPIVTGFAPNTQYTFSFKGYNDSQNEVTTIVFYFAYEDQSSSTKAYFTASSEESFCSITSEAGKTIKGLYISSSTNTVVHIKDVQCEPGGVATEYTEYTPPKQYVPLEDGRFEEIDSEGSAITISVDNQETTVSVEYNRDINKAFAELTNAIISLGGNI